MSDGDAWLQIARFALERIADAYARDVDDLECIDCRCRTAEEFDGNVLRFLAGRASNAVPPAAVTRSGIQCPALIGGSIHSTHSTPGRPPPAGSRALLDWLADIIAPIDGDRPFGEDLQHLIEAPWPPT